MCHNCISLITVLMFMCAFFKRVIVDLHRGNSLWGQSEILFDEKICGVDGILISAHNIWPLSPFCISSLHT